MQIVLLVVGGVSGVAIQQWGTALLLISPALRKAIMGLNQEGKAEASIAALQKMMIATSRVRHDGEVKELPANQIAPGDIVQIGAGDRIPADGRLVEAATLEVGESALTGESVPFSKQVDPVGGADVPLGDRVDTAYMNTNATRGSGELLVTATGMSTEVGHISGLLRSTGLEETS